MKTAARPARAFTLVEVLIAVAIIAVLLSLLFPTLGVIAKSGRAFRCQMGLRSTAFDFQVYADDSLHGDRGNDEQLPGKRFMLETFQESQYQVDEFWTWDGDWWTLPDDRGNNPMRCSEVKGPITLRRGVPCRGGAVGPPQNVSFGFNLRLHWSPPKDGRRGRFVQLDSSILEDGTTSLIPIAWDVDGTKAKSNGAVPTGPFFSAPDFGTDGQKYWYPALRHVGKAHFAFVDGSVQASGAPLDEPGWLWYFAPKGY